MKNLKSVDKDFKLRGILSIYILMTTKVFIQHRTEKEDFVQIFKEVTSRAAALLTRQIT